jgi:methylated-DNA-[protein]-cysteine S-methyltransferase
VLIDQGETPFGPIFLAAGGQGLCRVTIPGEPFDELLTWLERKIPSADLEQAPGSLAAEAAALGEFLESGAELPSMPVELVGTPFQVDVWQAVLAIPYGETRSYAEIARAIGHPLASRAVGSANAVNPLPFIVPCHRVVGADGSIKGFPGGVITRRDLLVLEGWSGGSSR